MLNERLSAIASFIIDGATVLDVGCDHALLDIALVKYKKNVRAIASDISEKALAFAKANIIRHRVEGKITLCLKDGLEALTSEVDILVICGMGGMTMLHILKQGKDNLHHLKRVILSANRDVAEVRSYMVEQGFFIAAEKLVMQHNKFYEIDVFEQGNRSYTEEELYFGPCFLKESSMLWKRMIKEKKCALEKIVSTVSNQDQKQQILQKIKRYENVL